MSVEVLSTIYLRTFGKFASDMEKLARLTSVRSDDWELWRASVRLKFSHSHLSQNWYTSSKSRKACRRFTCQESSRTWVGGSKEDGKIDQDRRTGQIDQTHKSGDEAVDKTLDVDNDASDNNDFAQFMTQFHSLDFTFWTMETDSSASSVVTRDQRKKVFLRSWGPLRWVASRVEDEHIVRNDNLPDDNPTDNWTVYVALNRKNGTTEDELEIMISAKIMNLIL